MSIKVLLACTSPVIQAGLRHELEQNDNIKIVEEANTTQEALRAVDAHRPDVAIICGIKAEHFIRKAKNQNEHTRILVLSPEKDLDQALELLKLSLTGYVLQDEDLETIIYAIQSVASGKKFLDPMLLGELLSVENLDSLGSEELAKAHQLTELSVRQRDVFHLIAEGKSNREIATELGITERTVRYHLRGIFDKLQLEGRNQAIALAARLGKFI